MSTWGVLRIEKAKFHAIFASSLEGDMQGVYSHTTLVGPTWMQFFFHFFPFPPTQTVLAIHVPVKKKGKRFGPDLNDEYVF